MVRSRKIKLDKLSTNMSGPGWADLPFEFKELVERSLSLQSRIERIDAAIFEGREILSENSENAVRNSLTDLQNAFAKKA